MRKLTTREYVLTVLLGVVAVFLFYLNRDSSSLGGPGSAGEDDEFELGLAPVVQLERLAGRIEDYDSGGRNLFSYYTPPPPVVKRTPPPVTKAETPRSKPPVINPRPPRPVDTTPRPPAIDLTYLGYLGPKENKIAVFEDGQDLLLARAGEIVREQFRVVDFGYETIVMGYVDERFKDQTTELRQKPGPSGRGRRR
jgi:hypothetical protein